uniref:HD_domain domain-containing protein n=1 Tax=Steinernema glaseri TaxID=37863 RepID=A0A1I8ADE8_9BILA
MTLDIHGIKIPDSQLAREITEVVRDTASPLLFHHSSRVFYFAALAGQKRGLKFDAELLYCGCMFHDMGLTHQHSSACERFEVDGANAARDFLCGHGIAQQDIDTVWTAIALHTTPGIPEHMHPVVALVTAGVEMDVLGLTHGHVTSMQATVMAMTPVAIHPSQRNRGLITCSPIVCGRDASSIMTTMMGTAITPLSTADQNSSFTGSVGVKHRITPPTVAAAT